MKPIDNKYAGWKESHRKCISFLNFFAHFSINFKFWFYIFKNKEKREGLMTWLMGSSISCYICCPFYRNCLEPTINNNITLLYWFNITLRKPTINNNITLLYWFSITLWNLEEMPGHLKCKWKSLKNKRLHERFESLVY